MQLTKEQTAEILNALGYQIDRSYKFKIRDEHTPSASINPKDGKIKDFGSGWYGDIVDFLVEFHNFNKRDAFIKVDDLLGKTQNEPVKFQNIDTAIKKENLQKPLFITQNIIDKFQFERKENFERYWELLTKTLPTASSKAKREIAQKFEIGYSKQADRLIMPLKDENGNCLTLWKYNPSPSPFIGKDGNIIQLPKVMFSKNRNRCPFNLFKLNDYNKNKEEPIFLVEGEKDCLNAMSMGFNAITLGSSSTLIDEKYLPLFKDLNLTIAYDFDDSGKNGAKAISQQLKGICKSIEILNWGDIAKKLSIEKDLKQGYDFTDYLVSIHTIQKDRNIEKLK